MAEASSSISLRLFIAIPLPDRVKAEVERAQAEFRGALPENCVRWTGRGQFHLTLRFLGNVDARHADEISRCLRETCVGFAPLQLRAERIGFFPDMRYPRVIWAWVHDEAEQLPKLQLAIESAMASFTREPSEEKFTGHVTVGRAKGIKRPQAEILSKLALGMANRLFGEWTADAVELIRSELSSDGSRYTTLAMAPLADLKSSGEELA
jgi:2'-5' RNA ligase